MLPAGEISTTDKIIASINTLGEKPAEEIRERLISMISELINTDFQALLQLLYRIDINEKKLKQTLKEHPGHDSASLLANLIIKRQLEKIASKKQFTGNDKPADDDRW